MPCVPPSALGETTADRVMGHRPEGEYVVAV